MCFAINPENNEEQTAEYDVPCFKFLKYQNGKYYAPHYSVEYELDDTKIIIVEDPLHNPLTSLKIKNQIGEEDTGGEIHEGLHSYITYEDCEMFMNQYPRNMVMAEFVIPKGSQYYRNKSENVSLQLRFIKLIDYSPAPISLVTRTRQGASGHKVTESWDGYQWNNTCKHSYTRVSWFWGTKICEDCGCHLPKN